MNGLSYNFKIDICCMRINHHNAHLTYCSNIHPGESWKSTFDNLKQYTTEVRSALTDKSFGIGLRLSNVASVELLNDDNLDHFKRWLDNENMYVFTINGFPYGQFHQQKVKDLVHAPDWTTRERLDYTRRLFIILSELLPENMDGGVSTSPISYKWWHDTNLEDVKLTACHHLAELIVFLVNLKMATGKSLHVDMEPEPDGLLETSEEFADYFNQYMLADGQRLVAEKLGCSSDKAANHIREHFQLCYDVCHFAVGYEVPSQAIQNILSQDIRIGRIQISAALASPDLQLTDIVEVKNQLSDFDEPVYLHQAVVKQTNDQLRRYPDLGDALNALNFSTDQELRTHFHVPVFTESYDRLNSTQGEIRETLAIWKKQNFTNHLEVETYTWDVLPENMRTDLVGSIVRELDWVRQTLNNHE